jgi:hypothetical protein
MDALDPAMKVLNHRCIPYYATAAEFAADKTNPAKRQAYRDAISGLREASPSHAGWPASALCGEEISRSVFLKTQY